MDQFCRKTHRIRCYGRKAAFINASGTLRRNFYLVSQRLPENSPEGHGFPEGQHPGNSDRHLLIRLNLLIRIILEQQPFAHIKKIRNALLLRFLFLKPALHRFILRVPQDLSPLTAVIGNPEIPVGKPHNRSAAVVCTEGTGKIRLLLIGKILQAVKSLESLLYPLFLHMFFRKKGSAYSPHNPRIWRPNNRPARILLHSPQNSIVFKGAALDYDLISQAVQIGDANHLCKYIFDDRPAKSCHDISRQLPIPLLRDNAAVHKNRTAASQNRRIFRRKGSLSDLIYRNIQTGRKILQERAASRRAGFIYQNIRDNTPVQPDGLHILSADIQDKRGVFYVLLHCPGMGYSLNHMILCLKCLGKQKFSVSGGTCSQNLKLCSLIPIPVPKSQKRIPCHF